MTSKVTFSIILPVYNVEKYLSACLDSIYSQSFQDFEIIAVNDGSTDCCLDILNNYYDKYGKMIIITQDNSGLSAARNVGVSYAKGEYICYVDSDDVISHMLLETVYNYFDETVEMVAFNHLEINDEIDLGDFCKHKVIESKIIKGSGKDVYLSLSGEHKYYNNVWRMCLRRSFLDEIGIAFVEGIYYEDVMYTLICYLNAKSMVYIDEKLYVYKIREGSITKSGKYEKSVDSYLSVLNQLLNYISEKKYDYRLEECILRNIGMDLIEGLSTRLFLLRGYYWVLKNEKKLISGLLNNLNITTREETFVFQYYLKGFDRLVRSSSGTIVYGAGGIGTMLGQYFEKRNMLDCINSYCVTEKKGNFQINGIEVRDIDYIKNFDKDILIIIAANATASEMKKNLLEYGYHNYITIDILLEFIISLVINCEK